jgi:alginate O-acetyltransferase complex protein AlgI
MVFSSYIFIFWFLPIAMLIYYSLALAPQRVRNFSLIILGYVFYGWADPRFVVLMFATTFIDWTLSIVIAFDNWKVWQAWHRPVEPLEKGAPRSKVQLRAITMSVVSNLLILGFFKYFNFSVDSYNGLMHLLGLSHLEWQRFFHIALPLGISFYTFQSLSYTIDVYRGDAKAMRNFIDFACFVSMFPHLVAGPILKFSYLAEQLEARTLTLDKFVRGIAFFSLGLAKKILLANGCAQIADAAFGAHAVGMRDAWLGAISYAFQIYFDFSGYSDMAIGLGLMLGFVFARNFDSPYRATSITDFWRRWHISLSTWLREYLYIPLGGNRKGKLRTYVNLMITMLLGGLWHGAAWTFVIWGAIHGGVLALERSRGGLWFTEKVPALVRMVPTFLIVVIAWVFFRASDLPHATAYLASMFGWGQSSGSSALLSGVIYQPYSLACVGLGAVVVWCCQDTYEWTQSLTLPKTTVCFSLLWVSLVLMATQTYSPFIYFVF